MDEGSVMVDEHAPEFQDWSARIEDPALQFELRNVLIVALDSLPEDYRAIVVLRDVEGLSPQDVSQITGLSVAVVKTRTHRARLVLRKRLGEYLSDRPVSLSPPSPRRGDGRAGRRGRRRPRAVSLPGAESRRCDRVRHRAARPAAEADRRSVSEPDARVHV